MSDDDTVFNLAPTRDDLIEEICTIETPDAHVNRALDTPTIRRAFARMTRVELYALWLVLSGGRITHGNQL